MPNIKSQIKRDENNKKQNDINSARKNTIRTAIKKVSILVSDGKKDDAIKALHEAISLRDKAAQDNVISRASANRKKASLEHLVATL
jgi:ribosomal protein S20